jgi:hypothetical protein
LGGIVWYLADCEGLVLVEKFDASLFTSTNWVVLCWCLADCRGLVLVGNFDVHTVKLVGFKINNKKIYN